MAQFEQADFDPSAQNYDDLFTYSKIGKFQRNIVWKYLEKYIFNDKKLNVLELNCGTGEDSVFFAQKGHRVVATDISSEMVAIAKQKAIDKKASQLVNSQVCSVQEVAQFKGQKFDLIFSNFGGLNCLDRNALIESSKNLSHLLKKDGHFIAVIMPEHCYMDSLYFFFKLQFSKIFRRATKDCLEVNVNGHLVKTFYYSPASFYKMFKEDFTFKKNVPVGLFVPPSFLENWYQKFSGILNTLDNLFNRFDVFSFIADHYLIDLEKK